MAAAPSRLLYRVARTRPGPAGAGLIRLCQEIADEFNLEPVVLQVLSPDGREDLEFCWPPGSQAQSRRLRDVPVRLGGEVIGRLRLPSRGLRRPGSESSRILTDVVSLLGPVLHLARLEAARDAELARAGDHAERIGAARRQAFAERDRERRELERDLHDGAQHHLVALRMGVALLEVHLEEADLSVARTGLDRLRSGIAQAEEVLLSTAAGNCPPMLVQRGLGAALAAELTGPNGAGQHLQLSVPGDGRRFPLPIETALYFTCLEAVNNARKHAPGAQVSVVLREGLSVLGFQVSDDGPGLDGLEPLNSFGLGNMRSRIEAVGGTLAVRTAPGVGTTVEALIPLS
jgi:signal transduction histidine kinase